MAMVNGATTSGIRGNFQNCAKIFAFGHRFEDWKKFRPMDSIRRERKECSDDDETNQKDRTG